MRTFHLSLLNLMILGSCLASPALAVPATPVVGGASMNAAVAAAQTAMRNTELKRQAIAFAKDDLAKSYKKETEQVIAEISATLSEHDVEDVAARVAEFRAELSKQREQSLKAARSNIAEQQHVLEHCRSQQQDFLKDADLEAVLALADRLEKRLAEVDNAHSQAGLKLRRYYRLKLIDNQQELDRIRFELTDLRQELAALETSLQEREDQILKGQYHSLSGLLRRARDAWEQLGVNAQTNAKTLGSRTAARKNA